ncbi:hypothetical protein [Paraburkholderia sp. DGU8]|jgi:hypothetical protein|uniref:hypothetical protein n=1 Tax=Paraburkholderia sp. DGU8 TaxID=3161997 RepID=UPI003465567D
MHERVSGVIRLLRECDSKKLADVRFKCEEKLPDLFVDRAIRHTIACPTLQVNAAAPASYEDAQKRAGTATSCFAKSGKRVLRLAFSIRGVIRTRTAIYQ